MPIYEYQANSSGSHQGCDQCRVRFEVFQGIREPALERCPNCGCPIERLVSAPSIHGTGSSNDILSNKNLANKGFTKYQKAGDGYYEKTAGSGPDVIKR
ncbi:MAG: zinc ribbon domain-containing protein [Planctomycetota bacterium]